MKKPTADCKHARFERETKLFYEADELADGCWLCGSPLVPMEKMPVLTLDRVGMDDASRQRLRDDPAATQRLLDMINQPEWCCPPCVRAYLDRAGARRGIPAEELLAQLRDREGCIRRLREDIAEVEACVTDCPYRVRLAGWRKALAGEIAASPAGSAR